MVAYLSQGLLTKKCIHQAEDLSLNPGFLNFGTTRVCFLTAAVLGPLETLIYTIATLILTVPYLGACALGRPKDSACRRVSWLFERSLTKAQGAFLATFVALSSFFWSSVSQSFDQRMQARLAQGWEEHKKSALQHAIQKWTTLQQKRLRGVEADEIYQPNGQESHFAILVKQTQEAAKRVIENGELAKDKLKLQQAGRASYTEYEKLYDTFDCYLQAERENIETLPVTYQDMATWSLLKTRGFKQCAWEYLDTEARKEANYQKKNYSKKFNPSYFYTAVQEYREQIATRFNVGDAALMKAAEQLEKEWEKVAASRVKLAPLNVRVGQIQRQIAEATQTFDQLKEALQLQQQQVPQNPVALQNLQARIEEARAHIKQLKEHRAPFLKEQGILAAERALLLHSIANGLVIEVNRKKMDLDQLHESLIGGKSEILKKVSIMANPRLACRLWRKVDGYFKCWKGIHGALEKWFDPDLQVS